MWDPDDLLRMLGRNPEKERERARHRAELEALRAQAKHAESEARWGKIGAIGAALSGAVALVALVIALAS